MSPIRCTCLGPTSWAPTSLALAHLGTLGMLGMVMLGALYQMTPVVAGSPVPRIRVTQPPNCILFPSPDVILEMPPARDNRSYLTDVAIPVPNDPYLMGREVYTQAAMFGDQPTFALTNAQDLRLGI